MKFHHVLISVCAISLVVTLVVVVTVAKQVTVMVMGTVMVMAVTAMTVVTVVMVVSKQARSQGVFQNHIKVDIFTNLNGRLPGAVFEKRKRLPCAGREGRLRPQKLLLLDRPQSKVTMTPLEQNPPEMKEVG